MIKEDQMKRDNSQLGMSIYFNKMGVSQESLNEIEEEDEQPRFTVQKNQTLRDNQRED